MSRMIHCIKFLFVVILVHQLFLDSIIAAKFQRDRNGRVILDESGGDFDQGARAGSEMLADQGQESGVGKKAGGNVEFIGQGSINLTVPNALTFHLCAKCEGSVHICYESDSPNSALKGDCPESSQCKLQIDGKGDSIDFGPFGASGGTIKYGKPPTGSRATTCGNIAITGATTKFIDSGDIKTCVPKFENGMIRLYVKFFNAYGRSCVVEALGATIKYPPIITTLPPQTSPKPTNSTATGGADSDNKSAEGSLPWWGIVLICAACIALAIIIGIILFCWCKNRSSSKKQVSPPTEISQPPTAIITTNNVHESTLSKSIQPPPKSTKADSVVASVATKPEPEETLSKEPEEKPVEVKKKKAKTAAKKTVEAKELEKKKTTVEEEKKTTVEQPTTTEDVPAPPPKPTPKPEPAGAPVPHIVPFSKKIHRSHMTSSVEEAMEKNKLVPVETVADSLRRNNLGSAGVLKEMKKNYPQVKRGNRKAEYILFCVSISQMFAKINELIDEYINALVEYGVDFDTQYRITSISSEGRKYLQDSATSGIAALFALGAEYHEIITDDVDLMHKFSVPLLMVIALQPRFSEYNRRKALSYLRRVLPFVRKSYTAVERNALPFPIPMIEMSFQYDPQYLVDGVSVHTDSESNRRKMEEQEAKNAALKKKKVDGQKKKKKSSKKRH